MAKKISCRSATNILGHRILTGKIIDVEDQDEILNK